MRLEAIPGEILERLRKLRYDRIIEKHEGPEKWSWLLERGDHADFLKVDGKQVLLPIPASHHQNVTILRCITSDSGTSLTLFLKDTTHADPEWESLSAGFIAICDQMPGEDFFVAIVYHEWFLSAPHRLD